MSICIVTPSYNGGGAERIAVNLANYYAEIGLNVLIVVFNGTGPYAGQVSEKVNVVDLNSRTRYVFFKLLNVLKKHKPSIVLSVIRDSNIFVGLSAYFQKSKVIFREANTMDAIKSLGKLESFFYVLLMRIAYRCSDKVIANSNDTRQDLLLYKIVNSEKIQVIGNPVLSPHFQKFFSDQIQHKWLDNISYKTILNVGRLHRQKNQALLIKAFAVVHSNIVNARLVILGEGEEKNRLMELINELNLSDVVELIPFQGNPYPYYKAADLFVLTSDWEGFGNVIVEAMASETPVISTNCPGGPKMILNNGEFGSLVDKKNTVELSEAILRELNNPTTSEQLKKAKQRAMLYSLEQVADKYLEVLY